jgi:hypothetical protein
LIQPKPVTRKYPPVVAKYLSTRNFEALVGQGWRWGRDKAREFGVPIIKIGDKWLIPAAEFFDALERASQEKQPTAAASPEDATAAVLKSLGLEVVR